MVHQLGHLGIVIDYGSKEPGSVLQHQIREAGRWAWQDYLVDGKILTAPVDIETLPPGEYRFKP